LSFTGYEFGTGEAVYGYKTGAQVTTRDGVFRLAYEHGSDPVNGSYDTIGGFVNVGFQVENLLRGESPVTLPTPVFNSPRSLTYWLTRQVKRNWHQPTAVVLSSCATGSGCDRSLASIRMTQFGPGFAGHSSFPAFPRSQLDPTKFIVVEFDYEFDTAPTGGVAEWEVHVYAPFPAATAYNQFSKTGVATGISGHMMFTLNTGGSPVLGQNAFILAGVDPDGISSELTVDGTSTLKITNVCIRFNQ